MDSKRRDRVAKACAQCRRKKIKCDGENPCNHCQNSKSKCIYESNKTRRPRKSPNEAFSNRLRRLEDMVGMLVTKMDSLISSNDLLNGSYKTVANGSSNGATQINDLNNSKDCDSTSEGTAEESDATDLPRQDSIPEGPQGMFRQFKALYGPTGKANDVSQDIGAVSNHYRGSHIGLNMIFSEQTINHIKLILHLGHHEIMTPLETMPVYMLAWKKLFQNIWSEPRPYGAAYIQKLRAGDFPDDAYIKEFLCIYENIDICWFICSQSDAHKLFEMYLEQKACKKPKGKKLSYSQLMVMSLVIAITVSAYVDHLKLSVDQSRTPLLAQMSTTELVALQEKMFSYTLFYYHRICTISEGLTTIKAILLMVLYLEMTWVYTDVNSTLCALAVRYAQDMGLHRFETYLYLPEEEKSARLMIWIACQFFDIEMCYRMGKAPLASLFDRSESSELPIPVNACGDSPMQEAFNKLTELRMYTYYSLFSAHVSYNSVKRIQETVVSLNDKLDEIVKLVDPMWRPRFYFDSEFTNTPENVPGNPKEPLKSEFLLNFHLTYFSHLMIINRVPWNMINSDVDSPPQENSKFRCISLDSARTILHLIKAFNQNESPFYCLNWFVTYPFSAAMNLLSNCINHPQDADTLRDINLLIDTSINFFGIMGNKVELEETRLYYLRFHMVDMVVRVVLLIAIAVVEQSSHITILGNNAALINHFNYVKVKYPHYFKKMSNTEVMNECMTQLFSRTGLLVGTHFTSSPTTQPMANYIKRESNSSSSYDAMTPNTADFANGNFGFTPDPMLLNGGLDTKGLQMWDPSVVDFSDATLQEYQSLPNFFFDNGI